jgi:SAM-dependent methyltransferase
LILDPFTQKYGKQTMKKSELEEYVLRNRAAWDDMSRDYAETGRKCWQEQPSWGIWHIPETEVQLLPSVNNKDVIELGCGTAYVSAWLAHRGARVTGVDNSEAQLKVARELQNEFGIEFPLIHGDASHVPLPDASFDLVISEYGASIWCDPYHWIPEAARLLRPGGQLIFLVNGTLLMLCVADDDKIPAENYLLRDYFGMHKFEFPDTSSVEFHLGYGDWIRLLRANNFEIENLIELKPDQKASTKYSFVTPEWARRWPSEEVWIARKRG